MVTALSAEYSSAPVAEVVKLAVHVVWAPAAVDDGTTVRPDTAFAVVIDTDAVAALVSAEVTTETDADPVVVVLVTALSATDSTSPAVTPEPVLNEQVSVVPLVLKLSSLTMLLVVVSVTTQVSVLKDPSSVPDGSVTETLPSAAGIPPVAEVVNPTVQSALAPAAVDVGVAETAVTDVGGPAKAKRAKPNDVIVKTIEHASTIKRWTGRSRLERFGPPPDVSASLVWKGSGVHLITHPRLGRT